MKRSQRVMLLLAVVMLVMTGVSIAQTSFAIMPLETTNDITASDRESGESSLYKYLIDSGRYKIIERTKIDQITKEQVFQISGATDQDNTVKIGKLLGVEKLIYSRLFKKGEAFAMKADVIDIATGQIEFTKEFSTAGYTVASHAMWLAAEIMNKYPLLGKVLGKAGDILVVNLGERNAIKIGDRLFVARKQLLLGDDNEVLFQEYNRIGIVLVIKLDAERAQTKAILLVDKSKSIEKEDLVSPEPIPRKEPTVSKSPLLADVKKGALLLEDDMEKKRYLSPENNKGEAYRQGKLHLDATPLKFGHTFCFYPTPFDALENIIVEGEVEFQKVTDKYNKASVLIRDRGAYYGGTYYAFFWNDEGSFEVDIYKYGYLFPIIPLQASPAIKRGESKNKFKIVVFGNKFDFYLNNQFLMGFEDEFLDKGALGFQTTYCGYATIDDVRIWEAVK